jgi:hypothetical protein
LIPPVSWTIISGVEQKRKKARILNTGLNETRESHDTRTKWNGRFPRQLKKTLTGGFKSKARKKKANIITAKKKDISLRNVDQPIKPFPLKSRGRVPKGIKRKEEIRARRRFMNCEIKKKERDESPNSVFIYFYLIKRRNQRILSTLISSDLLLFFRITDDLPVTG